ncbi:MAG: tetratricopeptide repeat protein [Bacteroidota bacterium]
MKRTPYIRITLSSVCLVIVFLFSGCSVFGPVGHAISQGYENSISYFNGYYNAKWLFDEAEDEIRSDALTKRGQVSSTATDDQIPASAKEKLLKVIDKCSNILAFHSTSTLVDDALMLIGKSFYYQAEYLKAERKFSELLTQYPNSPLVLETQIWYARTEEKLKKIEAGIRMCESIISAAKLSDDNKIETQAHRILGRLYLQEKQTDKAVMEFEKEIALLKDDDTKAEVQMNLGSIYFSGGQYEKAAEAYLQVGDFTSDIYSNYYSKVQAAIVYREIKEYEKGLTLVEAMIENFRYKSYLPDLIFERANNYAASGKKNEAIDEYIYVDTAYAKSEYALRSAYQLGVLYEKELGDYQLALKYYAQVDSATGSKFVSDGRLKFAALKRYFGARKKLQIADSLLFVLTDTTQKTISDTLTTILSDTTKYSNAQVFSQSKPPIADLLPSVSDSTKLKIDTIASQLIMKSRVDSLIMLRSLLNSTRRTIAQASSRHSHVGVDSLTVLKSIADSIQQKISLVSSRVALSGVNSSRYSNILTAPQPVFLSADSCNVLKSIAAQDLGDIFYSEVVVPDSAFYWYEKSLALDYSLIRSPRILYILAELSRMNTGKKYHTPEEYYTRLDHDFPESIYAEEARRFLGKESSVKKTDSAAISYEQAEKQIETKQYTNAIKAFHNIAQSYPKSPLAAKSEYAIGWILENHLEQPESALVQYQYVVKYYDGTKYAIAAANRSTGIAQSDNVKRDVAKINDAKTDTSKIHRAAIDSTKIHAVKIDTIKINKSKIDTSKIEKIDTSKSNPVKIDTSKMKATKIDTSEINSSSVNQKAPSPAGAGKDSVVSRKKIEN